MPQHQGRDHTNGENWPIVRVKPRTYQPNKAELEEPITLPAGTTPLRLARAAVTPVRIVEDDT